jgi:sugar-specific transcriptional regulator TrmB
VREVSGSLVGLGLTLEQEAVFTALLERGRSTLIEAARDSGLTRARAEETLSELLDSGLVSRTAERSPAYLPLPAEQAVDLLVRKRTEDIERARQNAANYIEVFRSRRVTETGDYLELVRGADAIKQRFMHAQAAATSEVVVFDKPPYVTPHQLNEPELALLTKGVTCRVVYAAETLELPGQLERIEALAEHGEMARVNARVPLKLFIVDRALAIVPLILDDVRAADEALIVSNPTSQ